MAIISQDVFDNDPDCAPLRAFLKKRIKNARKLHHKKMLHLQSKDPYFSRKSEKEKSVVVAEAKADAPQASCNPCNIIMFGFDSAKSEDKQSQSSLPLT